MLNVDTEEKPTTDASSKRGRGLFARLRRDRKGSAAIEFAILAMPFFIVTFASVETFVAFTGEQLLASATDTMARKVRTGEITFGLGRATDMSEEQFRKAFCDELSVMITCGANEAKTPGKLYIDVRSVANFNQIPVAIPRKGSASNSDLDTTGFKFAPGGPTTINSVRVFYRWEVMTDLIRPQVTNLRSAGSSMPNDYLMVATSVFRNENF